MKLILKIVVRSKNSIKLLILNEILIKEVFYT